MAKEEDALLFSQILMFEIVLLLEVPEGSGLKTVKIVLEIKTEYLKISYSYTRGDKSKCESIEQILFLSDNTLR